MSVTFGAKRSSLGPDGVHERPQVGNFWCAEELCIMHENEGESIDTNQNEDHSEYSLKTP